MSELQWGLMGRDVILSSRRVRALGLGATVRNVNDAAVPGLGALWYGKQLLWSLLGIHVAQSACSQGKRVSNAEVANAIEAMACIIGMTQEPLLPERIRGRQKLQGKPCCPFSEARRSTFYVSQPMRMGMVQPLLHLGLVQAGATRFNAYSLSEVGKEFLHMACAPYGTAFMNKGVPKALLQWVMGSADPWKSKTLQNCLHPAKPFPKEARALFRGLLNADPRRRDAFLWVQDMLTAPQPLSWTQKPAQLTQAHWGALHAGSLLFIARDAALATLETVEKQLDKTAKSLLPLSEVQARDALHALRLAAQAFLDTGYEEQGAILFCQGCTKSDDLKVLRFLIELDGRVLRLVGNDVLQGEAFLKGIGNAVGLPDADTEQDEAASSAETDMDPLAQLPNISFRIGSLRSICQDLLQASRSEEV